ncbi:MAG TPA: potassium transporter TrkG [Gemmatimonadales bacterium]|nr:potassium transporter TrkG [Gemmatimonadales bacterium]
MKRFGRAGARARGAASYVIERWLPRRRRRTPADLWDRVSPAQMLVISFAILILLGTLGFRYLPGLYTGDSLTWTDSLFTATSAVCVTGLVVVDTGTFFTPWGQAWILVLMQAGGLGLLTLTSLVMLGAGRRPSLRHSDMVAGAGTALPSVDVKRLLSLVFRTTFAIEGTGALLLYAGWIGEFGTEGAIWPSIFHAVSAFCNAGFSIMSLSFMTETSNPIALTVTMMLVMLGGLGFLTVSELASRGRRRHDKLRRPLSLHTKVVIAGTLAAIVIGAVTFGYFEWNNTLAEMSRSDKLVNSAFASVVARTAGFNSVDFGSVSAPTALMMMILMFIGGAPASTAGGIKITTAMLIFALMVSRLRGRDHVSAWNRSVPAETIDRAVGLTVLAGTTLILALFLLIAIEAPAATEAGADQAFINLAFEATSALGTVGLSMNTTPTLSEAGRLILVALMFIGRVGLLSVGAAIALGPHRQHFRYAYEDVAVG